MATLEERNALAAEIFPVEWAKALTETGKRAVNKRRCLRNAAEAEVIMRPLRERGECCATCSSFDPNPTREIKNACLADSDFHGYAITQPENLCGLWKAKS